MKIKSLMLSLPILYFSANAPAIAKPDGIKGYGIYVKGDSGYIKVRPFDHQYIDYKYYADINHVIRSNDKLEMLIYKQDFKANQIGFALRSMSIIASDQTIAVDIEPMDEKDMYKVSYDKPVANNMLLLVQEGYWFSNYGYGVMALGDPQVELVTIFSDMKQDAYAVLPSVQDAVKVYPDNKKLQQLIPQWEEMEKNEKDNRDYKYIEETWNKYKDREEISLQVRYLKEIQHGINGYLANHPEGIHQKEAKKRQDFIATELPALEKKTSVMPTTLLAGNEEVGKYPKMFKSDDYIITMLRLGKEEENTVLIKVDGIDNQFDGQIYKHTKICDNTKCTNYKFETKEIPGKKRWWTFQSTQSWGNYDAVVFYPPGIDKKSSIYPTERPKDFDSDKFYKEYLGQKARR